MNYLNELKHSSLNVVGIITNNLRISASAVQQVPRSYVNANGIHLFITYIDGFCSSELPFSFHSSLLSFCSLLSRSGDRFFYFAASPFASSCSSPPRENPTRYKGLKITNVHIVDWFPKKRANHWRGRFDSVRVPFKQRTDQTTPHTNKDIPDGPEIYDEIKKKRKKKNMKARHKVVGQTRDGRVLSCESCVAKDPSALMWPPSGFPCLPRMMTRTQPCEMAVWHFHYGGRSMIIIGLTPSPVRAPRVPPAWNCLETGPGYMSPPSIFPDPRSRRRYGPIAGLAKRTLNGFFRRCSSAI